VRRFSQGDFLALWETGHSLHPLDRAVLAIQAGFPEVRESVADWPMGRRNRALIELYCAACGPALRGWTACIQCGDRLEFQMDGRLLAEGDSGASEEPIVIGRSSYRLPTSRDLADLATEPDLGRAAHRLVQRCRIAGDAELDEEAIEAIGELMAAGDPLAEITLRFECPTCGSSFDEVLDLTTFLWTEIEVRAKHLLLAIHKLASAYGWSEAEILSLSPARRETYLGMVDA
jgi:hypothetical protein